MPAEPLTLCYVSREYPPAPRGGIGTYLSNLLPRLAEKGHQVHMITEWLPGALRKETQGNLTIHRLLFRDHEKDSGALHPALEALPGIKDLFSDRDFAAVFAAQVSDYLYRLASEVSIDMIEAPEYEAPLFYFQTNRLLRKDWPNIPCMIHLHSPSEHRINGESFPAEFHFVHSNDRGELAVLGVLIRAGARHPGLARIGAAAPTEAGKTKPLGVPITDLDAVPEPMDYYRYDGSLTTPPCTEGVT